MNTVRNHTATHLLQAALMQILGKQVKQAGSLVCPDYLRFDFTYHEALSEELILQIEQLVNEKIQAAISTVITQSNLQEAKEAGVISFFGEKYNPERVRVVTVPGFSSELCGGTHAHNTGIIGAFKITSESSLSTGTRRIVAVTGAAAIELFQKSHQISQALSERFKVPADQVLTAVEKLQDSFLQAQSEIRQLTKQLMLSRIPELVQKIEEIGGVPFLYAALENCSFDECKLVAQELEKSRPGLYYFAAGKGDQRLFSCFQSRQSPKKIDLKALSLWLKQQYHHRGGGNELALQGSVMEIDRTLPAALKEWIAEQAAA